MCLQAPKTPKDTLQDLEDNAMKPKKPAIVEPKAEISFGPFSEPRTIPGGWDVSAFFTPEPARQVLPEALPLPELSDDTEDTLS